YPANPTYDGKAFVGVNARYQSGAPVPSGNLNFHLQGAPQFKSTGFDWLVINGPRARLQGSGTLDGAGSYGFLLSVIDGAVSGAGGPPASPRTRPPPSPVPACSSPTCRRATSGSPPTTPSGLTRTPRATAGSSIRPRPTTPSSPAGRPPGGSIC